MTEAFPQYVTGHDIAGRPKYTQHIVRLDEPLPTVSYGVPLARTKYGVPRTPLCNSSRAIYTMGGTPWPPSSDPVYDLTWWLKYTCPKCIARYADATRPAGATVASTAGHVIASAQTTGVASAQAGTPAPEEATA